MIQLHSFWKTMAMAAASSMADGRLMLADVCLRIIRVLVLLSVWRTLVSPDSEVAGFTLAALLTYTVIAEAFAPQLYPTSELGGWLWEGLIANRLHYPVNLLLQVTANMVGNWMFSFCAVSIPVVLLSLLLGADPLPTSVAAFALFVPSLLVGITIGVALDFIFSTLMVALDVALWVLNWLRMAVVALLSGAVLPLAILPWGLGEVFQWLPFASMASAPLLIYTGSGQPFFLMLIQIAWAAGLSLAAYWLWQRNRERLVGFGG